MKHRSAVARCALLVMAFGVWAAQAKEEPGLSASNFVEAGDSVADMLDTSGLAFATMLIGAAAREEAAPSRSAFRPRAAHAYASPCPGGGRVHFSVRDADASGDVSTGDRFVTVFEACVIEGSTVTGRSEFVVLDHRFEGSTETTELEFHFKDLGTTELRWSGPARVLLRTDLLRGTERYLVEYRDLAVQRGARGMRWNFSLEMVRPPIGNQVVSVNGAMTIGELRLQLQQDEPFAIPADGFARTGQLTASDAHGARLQVEAGRSRYAYRLFLAGNDGERPDAASQSKPHGQP